MKRARNWSGLMPSALVRALELLTEKGLIDDRSRAVALKGVCKLEQLRQDLIVRLEDLLRQDNTNPNKQLLLTGQSLADQLTEVEELTAKVKTLLKKKMPK